MLVAGESDRRMDGGRHSLEKKVEESAGLHIFQYQASRFHASLDAAGAGDGFACRCSRGLLARPSAMPASIRTVRSIAASRKIEWCLICDDLLVNCHL